MRGMVKSIQTLWKIFLLICAVRGIEGFQLSSFLSLNRCALDQRGLDVQFKFRKGQSEYMNGCSVVGTHS